MHEFEPWKRDGDRIVLCGWGGVRKWNKEAHEAFNTAVQLYDYHGLTRPDGPRYSRPLIQITTDVFDRFDGPVVDGCKRQLWRHPNDDGDRVYLSEPANDEWRPLTHADLLRDLFALMDQCPNLDFEVTTEWPELIRETIPSRSTPHPDSDPSPTALNDVTLDWNRPKVYLGIRATDQDSYDRRVAELAKCRDLCAGLVAELELAGPIDIRRKVESISKKEEEFVWSDRGVGLADLVPNKFRVGGQSGPDAAPCNVDWIRSVVAQCEAAGVPCEVTQLGSKPVTPINNFDESKFLREGTKVEQKNGMWHLKLSDPNGADKTEWPKDLQEKAG